MPGQRKAKSECILVSAMVHLPQEWNFGSPTSFCWVCHCKQEALQQCCLSVETDGNLPTAVNGRALQRQISDTPNVQTIQSPNFLVFSPLTKKKKTRLRVSSTLVHTHTTSYLSLNFVSTFPGQCYLVYCACACACLRPNFMTTQSIRSETCSC